LLGRDLRMTQQRRDRSRLD